MRKLFKELFYVPKYGKVHEKVMLMQVVLSVSIIVMCLAAMSLSAYAYFSYNVTSGSNTIKAANFETNVQVQIANETGEPVDVITRDGNHTAELKANTEYYITLQSTDRSTAKNGFVIITAENCDSKYHTAQLGKDDNGNAKIVAFWLKPNADTKVTFLSRWGTSSYYSHFIQTGENTELYILENDHVNLSINPTTNNDPPSNNTENKDEATPTDTTTPPTTEDTTPPKQTTLSEIVGTSEPTTATELRNTTETSAPTDITEITVIQTTETTAVTGTESTEPAETQTIETTVTQPATETTEPTVTQPATETR